MTYSIELNSLQQQEIIAPTKQLDTSNVVFLIAALNEEKGIASTIYEIQKELGKLKIVVVDGKSVDHTADVAKNLGAKIFFQKKTGKGNAISEGLAYLDKDSKYVVFTDADYTYPARHVKEMIEVLDANKNIGMVLGNRFSQEYKAQSDRNQFYLGNRLLGFVHWVFNGAKLNDPFTGLRIIRYELLKNWKPEALGFDIEAEINHHIIKSGYDICEIPIKYRKRVGKKKLGFRHGLRIFQRIVLQGF